MSFIKYLLPLVIIYSCTDIGKDYSWEERNLESGFSRRYGSVGYDYGWAGAFSPFDQGLIIIGRQNKKIVGGQSDIWAIKTDSRGLVEWEKTFGGKADEDGYDVIATSDNGFLFVGYSWSFSNSQQVYVIKTNFHGIIEWEKTFGGSMWEVGTAAIELTGGGYLISGFSNSPGLSSGNTDFYLIKINNKGGLIWEKTYGNKVFPNHEWANDLIQLPDGGFIVSGSRDRYDKGGKNPLVIRLDPNGSLIWEKEFKRNDQVDEIIYSISSDNSGGYYLCSSINSLSEPHIYKPKITKIDALGNINWERIINSNSRHYHQFRANNTYYGDIILVGSSSQESVNGPQEDAFLTKMDKNGEIIWSYPYGSTDFDDWGWFVFETSKSNIVLVGSTKSFGASLFDIYLVGTDSEGILE